MSSIDPDAARVCTDGVQCCGFARYVFYKVFKQAVNATGNKVNDQDYMRPEEMASVAKTGDFIDCYAYSGQYEPEHYAIVLKIDGNNMYLYESNVGIINVGDDCNRVSFASKYNIDKWKAYRVFHANNYDVINGEAYNSAIDCPVEGTQYQKGNGDGIYVQGWISPREGLNSVDVYIDDTKKVLLPKLIQVFLKERMLFHLRRAIRLQ